MAKQPLLLLNNPASMATIAEVMPDKFQLVLLDTPPVLAQCDPSTFRPTDDKSFRFPARPDWQQKLSALLAGNEVFLGFGEEPEGEYLSWIIQGYAREQGLPEPHRLHLAALTTPAILNALKVIDPVDLLGSVSIYIRALFHHCFQDHLKRLLGTDQGPDALIISPFVITALTCMAEREAETISSHQANTLQLQVTLRSPELTLPLTITEIFNVSADGLLQDNKQANAIAKKIADEHFTILAKETSPFSMEPLPPHDLPSLLTDAFLFHQIPPVKALPLIEELFLQGGEPDKRRQGLISSLFPSTAPYLQELKQLIQATVTKKFGADALSPRDIAPQAILPLQPQLNAADLGINNSAKGQIYELIRCRALAWQMQNAQGERSQLRLGAKLCRGIAQDNQLTTPGFLQQDDKGFPPWNHGPRPNLAENTPFTVDQVMVSHSLQPTNSHYTLSSLWEELTEFRGTIYQEDIHQLLQLLDKNYISLQKDGQLRGQKNLHRVTSGLNRAFPGMKGLNLVAYYEQTVAEAISGRKNLDVALRQFDQNLVMHGTPLHKPKIPTHIPRKKRKSSKLIKSSPLAAGPLANPAKVTPKPQPEPSQISPFTEITPLAQQDEQTPTPPSEGTSTLTPPAQPSPAANEPPPETPPPLTTATADLQPDISPPTPSDQENPPTPAPPSQDNLAATDNKTPETTTTTTTEVTPLNQQPSTAKQQPTLPPRQEPDVELTTTTKPCPECGRPMVLKTDRFGNYWSCSGSPACHHSESKHSGKIREEIACPICGHNSLIIKRTPTGKEMYVCPSKSCDFMSWAKPRQETCPLCHSPFLVEKSNSQGQISLRCPKAGCRYKHDLTSELSPGSPVTKKKVIRRKKGRSGKGKKRVVIRRKKK